VKITIQSIPSEEQRYETSGDYWWDGDTLEVRVSESGEWRYDMLTAIHEVIEAFLVRAKGVTIDEIDTFDINFEAERQRGLHSSEEEPGDSPAAPYFREHQIAIKVERELASEAGVDWDEYENA
jgi:hypothetical protein